MMLVEIKLEDSVKSEEVENLQKYFGERVTARQLLACKTQLQISGR